MQRLDPQLNQEERERALQLRRRQYARFAMESNVVRSAFNAIQDRYQHLPEEIKQKRIQQQQQRQQRLKQYQKSPPGIFKKDTYYIVLKQYIENNQQQQRYVLDQRLSLLSTILIKQNDKPDVKKTESRIGDGQIYIGRSTLGGKNYIYVQNDLVSRIHCRIIQVENDMYPLCRSFVSLLYCREMVAKSHPLYAMPKSLLKKIMEYARTSHGYFLIDDGSRNGTYVQIKRNTYQPLLQQFVYCLAGERYQLRVKNIFKPEKNTTSVEEYNREVLEQLEHLRSTVHNPPFIIQNEQIHLTTDKRLSLMEIVIKLDTVSTQYVLMSSKPHVTLGLHRDIHLDDPAIPYTDSQAQIRYNNQRWEIKDGGMQPSNFGTWRKMIQNQLYKLQPGISFKLGSSVSIQFDISKQNPEDNLEFD